MPILEINNLSFSYDKNKILDNLNFKVQEQEIFGILGPNGSGKSTLLRLISNFLTPDSGEIKLDGKDITAYSSQDLTTQLAVLVQQQQVGFDFTVREIVSMGRKPYLKRWQGLTDHDEKIIDRCLELTNTAQFSKRRVNSLSGGEQQRVFLAQTLAQEPKVLLLDEPTSELDINYQLEIFNLIKDLKKQGLTIIVIMHNLNLAGQYCDRLALLNQQQIKNLGTPQEVITEENIKEVYGCAIEVETGEKAPFVKLIND